MSHALDDPTDPGTVLSDRVVALLRTAVPAWWGSLIAWVLAAVVDYLPVDVADALTGLLDSEVARGLAVAIVIAAWYAVWRWAEPHVPAWLVRLVLGSARTPAYAPVVDGVAQITTLPVLAEAQELLRSVREDGPYPAGPDATFTGDLGLIERLAAVLAASTGQAPTPPVLTEADRAALVELRAALADDGTPVHADPAVTALDHILT